MRLRPVEPGDHDAVLVLNAAAVDRVSPMDAADLEWFVEHAHRAVVVDQGGEVAAFAIVLLPGSAYQSPNYRWFHERYEDFWYLDRIAVADRWKRQGLGTAIYDEMERGAAASGRLCCEVDLDPPNTESLAFHEARGYREAGQLRNAQGKMLTMLVKELARAG